MEGSSNLSIKHGKNFFNFTGTHLEQCNAWTPLDSITSIAKWPNGEDSALLKTMPSESSSDPKRLDQSGRSFSCINFSGPHHDVCRLYQNWDTKLSES